MNQNDYTKKALHTPFAVGDPHGAISMPVYNSVAFEYESAEAMELAFTGRSAGHVYSRISNPTVVHFEEKVKAITGAHSVTALNSGMAAISNALLTIVKSGTSVVTTRHLFGNTYSLLATTLNDFGVETRFCDLTDLKAVETAIDDSTSALFLEIISNPQMEVADLKALTELAHQKGVPVIADTTLIPFCAFRAGEWGVDIEVVSSTKYISGGATSLGGLILDYGTFDWSQSKRLATLAMEQGLNAFTFKLKKEIHRNMGAYMPAHAAYMQTLGLETMNLRYQRASSTAAELARQLEKTAGIACVTYGGLPQNPYYEISKKQFGENPGAMLTFDLESQEACYRWLNKLTIIHRATNLFDNKTLAIHPYTTIYGSYSKEAKAAMHLYDTTIRLSVGLEDPEILMNDIRQALQA